MAKLKRSNKPTYLDENLREARDRIGAIKWTQKDGTKICLREMSIEHIGKCVLMLERRIEELQSQDEFSLSESTIGNMAFSERVLIPVHIRSKVRTIEVFLRELGFRAMNLHVTPTIETVCEDGEKGEK